MVNELNVATGKLIRQGKRKPVETPDGIFIIRKLQPMDFLKGGSVLPLPAIAPDVTGSPPQDLKEQIEKEVKKDVPGFLGIIFQKGVVAPKISADPVPEDSDAVWINDLDDKTLETLIQEINEFAGLIRGDATFRPEEKKEPSSPPQAGESVPENAA